MITLSVFGVGILLLIGWIKLRLVGVARKKMIVADVPSGSVCRFQGEWGVLNGLRFDSWEGRKRRLKGTDVVEALPPSLASRHGRPKGTPRDPGVT